MYAAIDAGSNTFRLLIGSVGPQGVVPKCYVRRICRLAGNYSEKTGLAGDAIVRALSVFDEFAGICQESGVAVIRAVGTAAFRMAHNGMDVAALVARQTGIPLEIISGETEACLTTAGVLSALVPVPHNALIIDIGGGSTEFILIINSEKVWAESYKLGVVRLTENFNRQDRQQEIDSVINKVFVRVGQFCQKHKLAVEQLVFVGTAGTVTTLAALDMQMHDYDWRRVNNHKLASAALQRWHDVLTPLSPSEREELPGMEKGRGDLIMAGLEILLSLTTVFDAGQLTVSDFGILEGLLLSMGERD